MSKRISKILAIVLSFILIFQQTGFTQIAGSTALTTSAELNIASRLTTLHNSFVVDKFRPMHLRYLQYLPQDSSFKLLLDKGDQLQKGLSPCPADGGAEATVPFEEESKTLLNYFFIGLTLPNSSFWVNLRPDSPDNIIDDYLAKTDLGKIMLETDLQLKKDTASFTSPQTPEGREYWDKLYKKAANLYGYDNVTIPTLTRPWIVPGEIIVRESKDSAYIYKATLKVMLEEDYLKTPSARHPEPRQRRGEGSRSLDSSPSASPQGQNDYSFKDSRSKALNEYSTQLIKELIIPKLTKEVNSSKRYAPLRQVYYSLILAQWFKARYKDRRQETEDRGQKNTVIASEPQASEAISSRIDSRNLTNLISKQSWTKETYFQAYQKSFKDGEYNIQEPVYTPTGQVIRSYFSGGENFRNITSPQMIIVPASQSVSPAIKNLIEAPSVSSLLEDNPAAGSPLKGNLPGKSHIQESPAVELSIDEIRQVRDFISQIIKGELFLENIMEEWRLQALLAKYLKALQAEKQILYSKLNKGGEEAYLQYADRYMEITELIFFSEFYLRRSLLFSQDPAYTRAAKILKRILEANGIKGEYHLVVPKSLPYLGYLLTMAGGNYVIISADTISSLENDDEALAWIIGHELAHCASGHSRKHLLAMSLHGDFGLDNVDFWSDFMQSQEKEADSLGLTYAIKAGYQGRGAIRALEAGEAWTAEADGFIRGIVGEEKVSSAEKTVLRVQTHPSIEERTMLLQSELERRALAAETNESSSAIEANPEASSDLNRQRIEQVRNLVREDKHDNIAGILVYGNVAKGTATQDSDLDYLIIKRKAFFRVSIEPSEQDFQRNMETKYPFIHHPPGDSLVLDSPLDQKPYTSLDEVIRQYFVSPEGVLFFEAAPRIPGAPFITDWKVIGKSDSEEKEITELIKERINVLTARNKEDDSIKNSSPLKDNPAAGSPLKRSLPVALRNNNGESLQDVLKKIKPYLENKEIKLWGPNQSAIKFSLLEYIEMLINRSFSQYGSPEEEKETLRLMGLSNAELEKDPAVQELLHSFGDLKGEYTFASLLNVLSENDGDGFRHHTITPADTETINRQAMARKDFRSERRKETEDLIKCAILHKVLIRELIYRWSLPEKSLKDDPIVSTTVMKAHTEVQFFKEPGRWFAEAGKEKWYEIHYRGQQKGWVWFEQEEGALRVKFISIPTNMTDWEEVYKSSLSELRNEALKRGLEKIEFEKVTNDIFLKYISEFFHIDKVKKGKVELSRPSDLSEIYRFLAGEAKLVATIVGYEEKRYYKHFGSGPHVELIIENGRLIAKPLVTLGLRESEYMDHYSVIFDENEKRFRLISSKGKIISNVDFQFGDDYLSSDLTVAVDIALGYPDKQIAGSPKSISFPLEDNPTAEKQVELILNSKGQTFDEVWGDFKKKGELPQGNFTDPRKWPIDVQEEQFAKAYAQMSIKELEGVFINLISGEDKATIIESSGWMLKFESPLREFIDSLSMPSEMLHYFKAPGVRIVAIEAFREKGTLNKEREESNQSLLINAYKYKAFIRELIKRWTKPSITSSPLTQKSEVGKDPSLRSGSIPQETKTPGGIDFRSLPIVTQAMSNLRLSASSAIGKGGRGDSHKGRDKGRDSHLFLDQDLQEIEKLVEAGITPSPERIKEYVASSCVKGSILQDKDKVILCIADILRSEEETCLATDPTLRDILVVLEASGSSAELSRIFLG